MMNCNHHHTPVPQQMAAQAQPTQENKSNNMISSDKPYVCDTCGRGYSYLASLEQHKVNRFSSLEVLMLECLLIKTSLLHFEYVVVGGGGLVTSTPPPSSHVTLLHHLNFRNVQKEIIFSV